jgi:hypothetical protein
MNDYHNAILDDDRSPFPTAAPTAVHLARRIWWVLRKVGGDMTYLNERLLLFEAPTT